MRLAATRLSWPALSMSRPVVAAAAADLKRKMTRIGTHSGCVQGLVLGGVCAHQSIRHHAELRASLHNLLCSAGSWHWQGAPRPLTPQAVPPTSNPLPTHATRPPSPSLSGRTFHCDEALGCFLLRQTAAFKDAEIVRTRDPQLLKDLDVVIDVGGVYDPSEWSADWVPCFFDLYGMGWNRVV